MRPDPNLAMVERIADALGSLREQVVFLGGSAAGLLLTDPAAPSIRPTKDVDVIVEVTARGAYHHLEDALVARGFRHDTREGAPICRWRLGDFLLDVMPTAPEILGFSNRWYPEALRSAQICELPSGVRIRLVAPPAFLATKLEAFFGRGCGDYLGSHDLEDLVAVIDGRPEIVDEVKVAEPALQTYLSEQLGPLLADEAFRTALQGHLPGDPGSQARFPKLLDRLGAIALGS